MPANPILVQDLTVRYQPSFPAVISQVNFVLKPGTMTMVIGPNGSGKTTLIKAILGLITYQGSIQIHGKEASFHPHAIGYVPQTHSIDLSFPMRVDEFLSLSHANCPDYVNRPNHINHTLSLINAQKLTHNPLSSLSGGQLQRVLLARAIMHQPRLLILDEPEAGIDVGGEQTLYDLLISLKKNYQMTILVSTHELDAVHHYADEVICLNKKVICQGIPDQMLTLDTLHQLYGHHVNNFYPHHHD